MAILMKAGDTAPVVRATLLDASGDPVDLTGASVRFVMATAAGATPAVDDAATLADAASGAVEYAWVAGDTDTPGEYVCEFEVTYADGSTQTFPTEGYLAATVVDDLGGTV
jgi:Rib/alpha/Esp surface antigen-like repeat protein